MLKRFALFGFLTVVTVILLGSSFYLFREPRNFIPYGYMEDPVEVKNLILQKEVDLSERIRKSLGDQIRVAKEDIKNKDTKGRPDLMQSYLNLGIYYRTLGDLGSARKAFFGAAREGSASAIPWTNLGLNYEDMGGVKLAEQAYQKALAVDPKSDYAYEKFINFARFKLEYTKVEMDELFQEALSATNNSVFHINYAWYLEESGYIKEAIERWKIAFKFYPENPSIRDKMRLLEENLMK